MSRNRARFKSQPMHTADAAIFEKEYMVKDRITKFVATAIGLMCLTMSYKTTHSETPEVTFRVLEERLLTAQVVQLVFHVTAVGAISADIRGTLDMEIKAGILLKANGTFAGDSVDLELKADNDQMAFGNRPDLKVTDTPSELRQALLIGLTRMGILHNLARLTGNALPDHAEGGVRDWVVVDSFTEDPQHGSAISFTLIVAGEPAGSAILEIGPDGQPVKRHQTVHFPTGEMRVVEQYSDVKIKQ
jgi:hypothetical protein